MAAIVGRDRSVPSPMIAPSPTASAMDLAAHRYNAAVVQAFADSVAIHRVLTSLNQPSSLRLP